ncbi:MAG TPA: protein kinase [Gemmatimonadaceae bacterium]|nr:protein kinase [Gemmatimonadaceae bacterium]
MAPQPDPLRERVQFALGDSYDIEAEIGRGGMGVVYRCRDRRLRRPAAVKVLPPDLAFRDEVRVRFLREAETAAQLNHPNIVPIYAVDDRDGLTWFAMALVDGESLAAHLARDPRPPVREVRRVLREVADALAYAHAHGIVHRDIKPDNILLDRQTGRPMVTDFGIARAAEGDSRLTVTGSAVGTPAYMSPEQATGERAVDGRSDQYSLGVVGYQMLAGDLPFKATNTPAMLMKHLSDPLRPLREVRADVPSHLASVIERALAKKPTDRWPDAGAFRDAVAATAGEADGEAAGRVGDDAGTDARAAFEAGRVSSAWKRPAVARPALPTPPAGLSAPPAPPRLPLEERPPVRLPRISGRQVTRGASEPTPPGMRRIDRRERTPVPRSSERWRSPSGEGLPPVPPWMPPSWHAARREWRHDRGAARGDRGGSSTEDRIRRFRNRTAQTAVTVGMLATINLMFSPAFLWFLFPATFMSFGLLRGGAALWADGHRFRDVFGHEATARLARAKATGQKGVLPARAPSVAEMAAELAPPEVLSSAYGELVRRAAADRAAAHQALAKLAPPDRALIPDVGPTVDALAQRVGSIALALHRLDEDVAPDALASLDVRLATARTLPESPERDRRIALLERQRTTLADLLSRREALTAQLESASLMLQNMRLDLLALGSAGVQSVLNDVTSATQEARALSRDIQIALEAAREIRT